MRTLAATAKQLQLPVTKYIPLALRAPLWGAKEHFAVPQGASLQGTLIAALQTAAACPRHGDTAGGLHGGKFVLPEAVMSLPDMCYVTCLLVFLQIQYFNKEKPF